MIIQANKEDKMVKFTWSDDMEEIDFITGGGVTDEELDNLLDNKVHEGCDWNGWTTDIKFN